LQLAVCILLGTAASVEDLWRRRISNPTVLAGLAAGLAIQIRFQGWLRGPLAWLAGASAGFAVFLVFFLAGGMGAGDIKLMAAFGACMGARQTWRAAFLAAIAGGLMACAYLLVRWLRQRWRRNKLPPFGQQDNPPHSGQADAIPYAPAIFIGSLLSFLA